MRAKIIKTGKIRVAQRLTLHLENEGEILDCLSVTYGDFKKRQLLEHYKSRDDIYLCDIIMDSTVIYDTNVQIILPKKSIREEPFYGSNFIKLKGFDTKETLRNLKSNDEVIRKMTIKIIENHVNKLNL